MFSPDQTNREHEITASISSGPSRPNVSLPGEILEELLNPPPPAGNDHWAVKKARDRAAELQDTIVKLAEERGVDLGEVNVIINGSMATGLFTGRKPRQHSLNSNAPECEMVIEADLRVIIGENASPHDPRVIDIVKEALKDGGDIHSLESKTIIRWAAPIPMTYCYQYEQLDEKTSFEWEICINKQPYFEIAHLWEQTFTPEEREWQLNGRSALRSLRVDLKDEFEPAKKTQCNECRWRIVSNYAMSELASSGRLVLDEGAAAAFASSPNYGQSPEMIKFLIDGWISGASGIESLDRPDLPFLPQSMERLREVADIVEQQVSAEASEGIRKLLTPPQAPAWANLAGAVQDAIRASAANGKEGDSVIEVKSLSDGQFEATLSPKQ